MGTSGLISTFIKDIFPLVDNELNIWKAKASKSPDRVLATQALSSIRDKSFHAQGGSFYALYPGVDSNISVKLIVAYQTISDYLDNLCDRAEVYDEQAFSYLHLAMTDALDAGIDIHDYYKYYPYNNDGGYLPSLVNECRRCISKLPSYYLVKDSAIYYAKLYSNLQVYKHLKLETREKKMFDWAYSHVSTYPGIMPSEFCAASGSTLLIFMLFSLSSKPSISGAEIEAIKGTYFPWICGLHIMLDYFIDYNEDIKNKDLNFVQFYKNQDELLERLRLYIDKSEQMVKTLYNPHFHKTIIKGLLAMYLSDKKADEKNLRWITESLISSQGIKFKILFALCKRLRANGVI